MIVNEALDTTFYRQLRPISENWISERLQVTGFTREQTLQFDPPEEVMKRFADWLRVSSEKKRIFISDNNGFDWQFINYYFHHFLGDNPFGHSSTSLDSLYKGLLRDMTTDFRYLRKTAHTHHPLDDALGNAEALLLMKKKMRLKISL